MQTRGGAGEKISKFCGHHIWKFSVLAAGVAAQVRHDVRGRGGHADAAGEAPRLLRLLRLALGRARTLAHGRGGQQERTCRVAPQHWARKSNILYVFRFPGTELASQIEVIFDAQFTEDKVAVELELFAQEYNYSFERTYGWAWLLKLQQVG